jgi:hypothetical protein
MSRRLHRREERASAPPGTCPPDGEVVSIAGGPRPSARGSAWRRYLTSQCELRRSPLPIRARSVSRSSGIRPRPVPRWHVPRPRRSVLGRHTSRGTSLRAPGASRSHPRTGPLGGLHGRTRVTRGRSDARRPDAARRVCSSPESVLRSLGASTISAEGRSASTKRRTYMGRWPPAVHSKRTTLGMCVTVVGCVGVRPRLGRAVKIRKNRAVRSVYRPYACGA